MPSISSAPMSNDPLSNIKWAAQVYASKVLAQETAISSPSAGYSAYDKRVKLAREWHLDADAFAQRALGLFLYVQDTFLTNGDLYNWILTAGGSGFNAFQADILTTGSFSDAGTTSGTSIWDVLAGVSKKDLL